MTRVWSGRRTVYITGHSLGGALASLTTFDLARIAQECYQQQPSNSLPAKKSAKNWEKKGQDATLYSKLFAEDDWATPPLACWRKTEKQGLCEDAAAGRRHHIHL